MEVEGASSPDWFVGGKEPQEAREEVEPAGDGGDVDGVGGPEVLMGEAAMLLHPLPSEESRKDVVDAALEGEGVARGSIDRLNRSMIAS